MTPKELLLQYPPLTESVSPLVTLAEVNPSSLKAIIELAMAMGIHACETKYLRIEQAYVHPTMVVVGRTNDRLKGLAD